MRLGGPVFSFTSAEDWVRVHRVAGYSAAYMPEVPESAIDDYVGAARDAGLVIAEVGAWSNPLSPKADERRAAFENCTVKLALAERVGARCCVNVAGSLGERWDGPHWADLTSDGFDAVVETTRAIIDAVHPTRTFYALETMPWMYPDSAQSYVRLLEAIDRPGCGAHLDPVNLISSPQRYFGSADLIREAFGLLGPHIRSCHGKDILLRPKLTVHLDEVVPGTGGLAYDVFLRELAKLDPDTPLMLEHLGTDDYPRAAAFVRETATRCGLEFLPLRTS